MHYQHIFYRHKISNKNKLEMVAVDVFFYKLESK